MLNFKLDDNTTLRVRFVYRHGKKVGGAALKEIKNKKIVTVAEISKRNDQTGEWQTLSVGQAIRDRNDVFRKSAGRRVALGKATEQLNNKPLQRRIWDEYYNLCSDSTELMISDQQ